MTSSEKAAVERLVNASKVMDECYCEASPYLNNAARAEHRLALIEFRAATSEARKMLDQPEAEQKPTAYVLHKPRFDGTPYFTTALVNEADYLFKGGYDIHQYLYVGPTPQPPEQTQ